MNQPRYSRLAIKILLLILGASLLQAVLSGWITQRALRSDMQDLLIEQQTRINRNAVQLIDRELDIRQQFLATLAAQLALSGRASYPAAQRLIDSQRANINHYFPGGILILNDQGVAIGESTHVEGRLGTRYADRPHIQQALSSGQPNISKPIMGRTLNAPIISISAPVKNARGEVLGLVAGVIELERENLFDAAVNLTLGVPSRLFVLDTTHQIYVTATDPKLAMQPLPDSADSPLLAALRSGQSSGLLHNSETGGDDLFIADDMPHLGWRVVSLTALKQITDKLDPILSQRLIIGLMFFLLLALALVLLLRRAMNPLSAAAHQITEMMEGQRPIQPIRIDRTDEVGHLVHAFNQLSQRQQQQARELQRERDLLRSQFDQSSDAIVLLDVHSLQILEANPQCTRLLGYSAERLRGRPFAELLAGDQPALPALLQQAMTEAGHCIMALLRQFGGSVHCEVTGASVGLPDQRQLMLNLRDISERLRSEQLKNDFVSTVSHELRTPLTSIYGSLRLVNSGVLHSQPEQAASLLQAAEENSQRLTALINDLLDIDKLEAGKLELKLQQLDVDQQLQDARRLLASTAAEAEVRLQLPAPHGLHIMADPQRFQQVLANLLSNAIKFSPPGAVVEIATQATEQQVRLVVIDQGEGIPLAFQPNVFQRFAQADATATRQRGGTGLGLAITRSLVRAMHGAVGFSSTPGQGSQFWVSLPRVLPPNMHAPRSAAPDSNGSKAHE
ncbi:ATP-binding protein [Halopseudomonas sp.]|uniref:ATP-binding protein n=1 Tax=Halopseudomonas sp. TaxID=2901191 RepID=UPI0030024F97